MALNVHPLDPLQPEEISRVSFGLALDFGCIFSLINTRLGR